MRLNTAVEENPAKREAPLDDKAMQQHARSLAVTLNAPRRAPLITCPEEAFHVALSEARRLAGEADALSAPLEWLCGNGRVADALFAALVPKKARRPVRLPAREDGTPRVQALLEEIVRHTGGALTAERLIDCLCAFDEVRALEMSELWAVPGALAAVLQGDFMAAVRRAISAQRERMAAARWVDAGANLKNIDLARQSPTFFEHALQITHARGLTDDRLALEKWLSDRDCPPETITSLEHERQALERLRLDNALAALRMLNALDWSACFSRVSRVEQTLLRDPAGTYPRMDDDCRAMVRERVTHLSARCGLGEATIAAAAQVAAENGEGLRREICWWLMTDEGTDALLRGMGVHARGVKKIHPDPDARMYRAGVAALAGVATVLLTRVCGPVGLAALPGILTASAQTLARLAGRMKPRRLLKLDVKALPEAWRTMVVMPVLLSSPEQAKKAAFELETLGCLEEDDMLTFALLGDLPDAPQSDMPEDSAILSAARAAVDAANRRAGRKDKYILLTRRREAVRGEGLFMAPDRKRGALNALTTLLTGGENHFEQEEAALLAEKKFAFLITLDAGTKMLPGTAAKLVGTLAHPLNRAKYAVLAPRMELAAENVTNKFVRLFGGEGGVDTYPTSVSDLWQDLAGEGCFGGKGIIDILAFQRAMEAAKLPAGRILSHDMLEGLVAGAGLIDNIALFEGHPKRAKAWFDRLHRWTRGDWQLVGFLFRRGFSGLDRWKIAANLVRPLAPVGAWLSLVLGFARGSGALIAAGLLPVVVPFLLHFSLKKDALERLLMRFSLLPHEAYVSMDAVLRTLFRLIVSKKHLLQWVTADDAERRGGALKPWPSRIGALCLLATVFVNPVLILPAALIAALWATAHSRVSEWEKPAEAYAFTDAQRARLMEIAGRTWRFFAENTPENGLTPDNVQLEPPKGAAPRTSPTNIGLYLVSCAAACALGIIASTERDRRFMQTMDTLERLDKWHGHLYNWYDIRAERPLPPRYVSSVDSGNLAASLLLCARMTEDESLSARLESLARGMDFRALYDEKKKLFAIGFDVENERLSESRYDLLASESRILSYAAMMLGQVPCAHFARLGRACARVDGGGALISWSGTAFEYLMPMIFLPAWENTLIGQTNRHIVAAQQARQLICGGEAMPWGVSESGFYAFDRQLNYQYRAFGLSEAALRGERQDDVIAPYASVLALSVDAEAAMENIDHMVSLGWADEEGFFEAADCDRSRVPGGEAYRLVKSHMAHHQGMILAAVCNALTGNALVEAFMARPEARALSLLLQERNTPAVRFAARREQPDITPRVSHAQSRAARLDEYDAHLMSGGDMTLACTSRGAALARTRDGLLLGRRQLSPDMPPEDFFIHARLMGEDVALTSGARHPGWRRETRFEPGTALFSLEKGGIALRCAMAVSPEDGAVLQRVTIENRTGGAMDVEITSCFAVALAKEADYEAHPAFQNLFIESAYPETGVLTFTRRARDPREKWPLLVHRAVDADGTSLTWETDLARLVPRNRSMSEAGALARELSSTLGHTLNPCSALRLSLRVEAGETREVGFAIGLAEPGKYRAFCEKYASVSLLKRAEELAATQAKSLLHYLALPTGEADVIDRATALLLMPLTDPAREADDLPDHDLPVRLLWPLGVSGERPMITAICRDAESVNTAREAARAHEYYRSMGLRVDLLLVCDNAGGYDQPVRGPLAALAAGREDVHLIDDAALSGDQRALLRLASALLLEGRMGFRTQVREALARHMLPMPEPDLRASDSLPKTHELDGFNGWGGFSGDSYVIENPDTPAPWCNMLCNERFGSMVTSRGGSFTWFENSRSGRLTPFDNDPLRDSRGERLLLIGDGFATDPERMAARVTHAQGESVYEGATGGLMWTSRVFVDYIQPVKCHHVTLKNTTDNALCLQAEARVDWLTGVSRNDMRFVRTGVMENFLWARGQIGAAAFLALAGENARAERGGLTLDIELAPHGERTLDLLLGCGNDREEIKKTLAEWTSDGGEVRIQETLDFWHERLTRAAIVTPDARVNALLNRFLPYQVITSRLYGRAGWYQPGGAYGFRDQLQDELSQLLAASEEVRAHILRCAAHQFESGDVQHWWHPAKTGVRTRVSDDMLFLPYAAGCYVAETGDESILSERVPFLKDVDIPSGRDDWYGEPDTAGDGTLHEHCLRAIERASRTGAHGLLLMGAGDWNDGMNRVGAKGRGESVWLTEFMIAVIEKYGPCCTAEDKERLNALAARLKEAVEREAWDGKWYLRAFDDEGVPLGGHAARRCRIDSLPQSWAALAGLDHVRANEAMDEVMNQLVDRENGLVRLLTPPFDGESDPGYIRGYPPGIRENGGQYTHAACWVVLALAKLGRAEEAWSFFHMLLPASHADTAEKAARYRVEPYVMAADVYDGAPHTGQGGWTWYTGAAGWMLRAAWTGLLGLEKRGDTVRMKALLPGAWNEISAVLRVGRATYTLTSSRACAEARLDGEPCVDGAVRLVDDGAQHRAVFPAREK